ncbi:MAG: hypothetical protein PUP46_06185 [Endozoicomonas sp. (ex Botrylloides leachii)]|nr:hypothetical protein [Endozoicomonas sp. (ex Botrylloides leachii)]
MLIKTPYLKKIPQLRAIDILSRYQKESSFKKTVEPNITPVQFINKIYDNKQWQDVVEFLCYGLFAKEAIWWGYQCILITESIYPEEQSRALKVVHKWLLDDSESCRRLAEVELEKTGLDHAYGWLLQAVFWSGGSLTPINQMESLPPPYLYSSAVAGAICLAAMLPDENEVAQRYEKFINLGINIAACSSGS